MSELNLSKYGIDFSEIEDIPNIKQYYDKLEKLALEHAESPDDVLEIAKKLLKLGFKLVATDGTQIFLTANKIDCKRVNKVREGRTHIVDMIKNNEIDLIINTTQTKQAIKDSYLIRREALQYKVCYTTTIAAANALVGAVSYSKNLEVYKLQDIFKLA